MGFPVKVTFGPVAELVLPKDLGERLGIQDGDDIELTLGSDVTASAPSSMEAKLLVAKRIMDENYDVLRRLAE